MVRRRPVTCPRSPEHRLYQTPIGWYCYRCDDYLAEIQHEEAARAMTPDVPRNPSHDVPEETQRRLGRWLTTHGPRIAAGVRWILRRVGLRRSQ